MQSTSIRRSFPIIPVLIGGTLLLTCLCIVVVAGFLFGGKLLPARTGEVGSSSKPVMPTPKVLETKTQTIGSEGGAIVLASGVRLVFPAGAVAQRISVRVNRLDPSLYIGEGSEGVVLDLSAPVTTFQEKVEFHIPLPDWYTPDDADTIIAGALDETTGAVIFQPSTVQIVEGRPELVLQTDHFSSWVIKWVKDKLGILPPQAGPLEIPYYSQGSTSYCWAATLQMVAEAAKHSETREVFDVIGTVGVDEDGLGARAARMYPSISGLMQGHTRAWPERFLWAKGTDSPLRSYIRRQIGIMGRPVGLVYGNHAIVVVGYDGTDFIVHDAQGLAGDIYKRASWAGLGLSNTEDKTTVVVPLPLASDRPLVTVNIMDASLEFVKPKTSTEADVYQFRWDYTKQQGYSFKSKRDGKAVASIPGEATELRLVPSGGGIEIANSYRSGGAKDVSVWIDITGKGPAKTHYSDRVSVSVAPGKTEKIRLGPISVDAFRDPATSPTEYTFKVSVLFGGKVVDDASFTFVMEPAKMPTPTTTSAAAPTTTPSATSTATTTPAPAAWILKRTEESKESPKEAPDWCYKGFEITLGGLSGTTFAKCTWPSPFIDVWSRTTHSWSAAPPPRLTAGETLKIIATANAEGTYQTGGLTGAGSTWVSIYRDPGGGPYPGAGWANVTEATQSASAVNEFKIPSGSAGGLMLVSLSFQGPGGSGKITYVYEWGTNGGSTIATPAVTTVTPSAVTPTAPPAATPTAPPAATPTVPPAATRTALPAATPTARPAATPTATPAAAEQEIFSVTSLGAANNGATKPTTFSTGRSWLVTRIVTYHWNNGRGVTPGTVGLRASNGTTYGPWQAIGEPGSGGVPNAYWVVKPNVVIPAGTYTVIDSDPGTWSQNQETDGAGMSWGYGIPR